MPGPAITIATTVAVPPDRAWEIYTDPGEIAQWNFASDDWHCPSATIDLRVGGTHKARMEAKDGSFGFDLEAVYTEVDAPRALTMVLADGRQSRTTFQPSADGTFVETTFDAETENSVEMQRDGWQAILNNFLKRTEQLTAG